MHLSRRPQCIQEWVYRLPRDLPRIEAARAGDEHGEWALVQEAFPQYWRSGNVQQWASEAKLCEDIGAGREMAE